MPTLLQSSGATKKPAECWAGFWIYFLPSREGPVSLLRRLVAFEWQQSHESSSFDRFSDGMLADRGATGFSATDDFSMTIDQLFQQFNIFVVDIHRAWPFAINVKWIFASRSRFRFRFATVRFSSHFCQLTGSLF